MIYGFWIIAIVMMALALVFLLPALRKKSAVIIDDRRELNIKIAKQQLKELEVERKEGNIEPDAYESAKNELEQALYNDLEGVKKQVAVNREKETRFGLILTAIFVPALAVGMYYFTGKPEALGESSVVHKDPKDLTHDEARTNISVMLTKLESKLKKEPNNIEGWIMLGRSYMVVGRDNDAVKAYTKANELQPDSPETLLPLADVLATVKKGDLRGKPEELVLKALEKEPDNIMGLWLAGMAARQRGVNAEALQYWQKLEPMLDPASDDRKEVRSLIAQIGGQLAALPTAPEAKQAAAPVANATPTPPTAAPTTAPVPETAQPAAANANGIKVTVSLAESLKDKVTPETTVFIYAKAMSGPPMPLAVVRKQVKDLPLELVLDDSMAMMPQLKISSFEAVKVEARVSLSGTPKAQPGDLFSEKSAIKMGDVVALAIDSIVSADAPTTAPVTTVAPVAEPPVASTVAAEPAPVTEPATAVTSQAPVNTAPVAVEATPATQGAPVAEPVVPSAPETPPAPATNTAAPVEATPAPVSTQPASVSNGIKVTVSLADALKAKVTPETTVFIYAKALSGPPMPLAVVRKQVKDLPLELVLDDSMAMMPQLKISSFAAVKVEARVSLSGTPKAQAGDLFSEKAPVKMGDVIELVMDSIVE